MTQTLYHFSNREPWPDIEQSGALEPRWLVENCRPGTLPTVHLSDSPDRELLNWAHQHLPLRFTVELPDRVAHPWHSWGPEHVPIDAWWSLGIPLRVPEGHTQARLSQWNKGSSHWWVVEQAIPTSCWREVYDLDNNQILWSS